MARGELSRAEARRIALAAQGFDRPRPAGRVGIAHLRRVIRQLGLIQIDYVNVLVPAQYQVPFSRLGPYPLARLDALVYRTGAASPPREFVEQPAHEASIVPVEHWPLLRHRMDAHDRRCRALTAFLRQQATYAAWVLDEIRTRGALTAGELEPDGPRAKKLGEFWAWSKAKCALEGHFATGALSIADRRNPGVARVYDLAERVIPSAHCTRVVSRDEALRTLLRVAARAYGVATVDDLADYYRLPARETRRHVSDLADAGELREVKVEGWKEPAYLHPKAARPREVKACALLSPFDPVVWYRARAARLFEFDYLIEIWVPAAKRRWGYYVLPFLFGDRLVARVDLKSDRASGRLQVLAAYLEPHADKAVIAPALAAELQTMARWLTLSEVQVAPRGNLARALGAAVRRSQPIDASDRLMP